MDVGVAEGKGVKTTTTTTSYIMNNINYNGKERDGILRVKLRDEELGDLEGRPRREGRNYRIQVYLS